MALLMPLLIVSAARTLAIISYLDAAAIKRPTRINPRYGYDWRDARINAAGRSIKPVKQEM